MSNCSVICESVIGKGVGKRPRGLLQNTFPAYLKETTRNFRQGRDLNVGNYEKEAGEISSSSIIRMIKRGG
jgi:hypothetical protein